MITEKMTEQEKDKAVTRALTAYSAAHRAYLSAKEYAKAQRSQQRALADLNTLLEQEI